jgi:polysaccharide export outer membrane protein
MERASLGAAGAALALAVAFGCAPTPAAHPISGPLPVAAPPDVASTYRVGPADTLVIRVLPEPAIERTVKVGPDGRFSFDLIGDVDAAGRSMDDIGKDVTSRMATYRQSPSVTVSLLLPSSTSVSVLGEVKTPQDIVIDRPIRVSEALARAGGATELAATSRVRVVRRQGEGSVLSLSDIDAIQAGHTETDVFLQRGDLVYVPAAIPVVVGYNIRRAIYPLEVLMRTIAGPLLGLLAGGGGI